MDEWMEMKDMCYLPAKLVVLFLMWFKRRKQHVLFSFKACCLKHRGYIYSKMLIGGHGDWHEKDSL
jgi:hypothetical protein